MWMTLTPLSMAQRPGADSKHGWESSDDWCWESEAWREAPTGPAWVPEESTDGRQLVR